MDILILPAIYHHTDARHPTNAIEKEDDEKKPRKKSMREIFKMKHKKK